MSVSLRKSVVAASSARDKRVLFGSTPVRVDNVQPAGEGRVTVSASTPAGGWIVRTLRAGQAVTLA